MGKTYYACAVAAIVAISSPLALFETAHAGDSSASLLERHEKTRNLRVEHVSRVDANRLRTIDVGLDKISRAIENGSEARGVLQGLSAIEASLLGLRLEPNDVSPRLERVNCLRGVVQQNQKEVNCKRTSAQAKLSTRATTKVTSLSQVSKLVQSNRSVGLLLSEDNRQPFVIEIYGPRVDVELAGFFAALARKDPGLLQPLPIERSFQFEACLSGLLPGLVHNDAKSADAAFLDMLNNAAKLVEAGDDAWRFTLRETELPEIKARTAVPVPDTLSDFDAEDALHLITADFTRRFGLEAVDPQQVSALRNLWTAQGDDSFRKIIAETVGKPGMSEQGAGRALTEAGLKEDAVWPSVYRAAIRALHCRDANKVFEAYGLVYKQGHYPAAREVLRILETTLGYPAVPGVSVSRSKYVFLEAVPQTCSRFGPVELAADGASSEECNLRKIKVDGRDRWEVLAGGAAVQFFVTRDQRREILSVMRKFENEPRGGDILRWRATTRVRVDTQSPDVIALPQEAGKIGADLPCVVSLSRTGSFEGAEALVGHIENYRKYFYPQGKALSPDALAYVFILDEFEGHLEREFRNQWSDTIRSFTETYRNISSLLEVPDATGDAAGQVRLPESAILPFCSELADQIESIRSGRDISHGEFVKSLLVGSNTHLSKGIGLLNTDGAFTEEDFAQRLAFWATEGHLSNVVANMNEARELIPPDLDDGLGPTIFNLSIGSSYRFADEDETADARMLIRDMKDVMGRWSDALFVVAAGQLEGHDERGMELKRVSALNADVDDPDCPFFPACLSQRSNVVTVGAVQPSATRQGHGRPVLIPWSNYGGAVTIAAPGASVLSKEHAFIEGETQGVETLSTITVRDGTSVATVFVTAIAARMAAEFPEITAPEIKRRLIATARPYNTAGETSKKVLFEGSAGELYSGVVDPHAALLDPNKYHVRWKRPTEGVPELQEFETFLYPSEETPFAIFTTPRERGKAWLKCRWKEIYRIHIETDISEDGVPLYKGGVACKNEVRGELIEVGYGPLGTQKSNQQHACMLDGVCFRGVTKDDQIVPIDLANVKDIYFPVVGK